VIRLIASDLDGTLLGADGHLSARTVAALAAADRAGIEVIAATGRSHRTAAPKLASAPMVRTVVCSNGASVYDVGSASVTNHRPLADALLALVVRELRNGFDGVTFGWETVDGFGWEENFLSVAPDEVQWGWQEGRLDGEVHDAIERAGPQSVTKLLVGHPTQRSNQWLTTVGPTLPDGAAASTSGADFVEVTGSGVDKGSTLAVLAEERGIGVTEVLAFGDQANDITMLAWAGRSVAMANAHPSALDAADEVGDHHGADAVARVIEELLA